MLLRRHFCCAVLAPFRSCARHHSGNGPKTDFSNHRLEMRCCSTHKRVKTLRNALNQQRHNGKQHPASFQMAHSIHEHSGMVSPIDGSVNRQYLRRALSRGHRERCRINDNQDQRHPLDSRQDEYLGMPSVIEVQRSRTRERKRNGARSEETGIP